MHRPLFESGTMNHSDTSPTHELYMIKMSLGKFANILLTYLRFVIKLEVRPSLG